MGYYKLHTALTKWNNAWKTCRDEGANLVVINTVREETEVMNIYAKYPNIHGAMWIGVHDQFVDNQFETVLGKIKLCPSYAFNTHVKV